MYLIVFNCGKDLSVLGFFFFFNNNISSKPMYFQALSHHVLFKLKL